MVVERVQQPLIVVVHAREDGLDRGHAARAIALFIMDRSIREGLGDDLVRVVVLDARRELQVTPGAHGECLAASAVVPDPQVPGDELSVDRHGVVHADKAPASVRTLCHPALAVEVVAPGREGVLAVGVIPALHDAVDAVVGVAHRDAASVRAARDVSGIIVLVFDHTEVRVGDLGDAVGEVNDELVSMTSRILVTGERARVVVEQVVVSLDGLAAIIERPDQPGDAPLPVEVTDRRRVRVWAGVVGVFGVVEALDQRAVLVDVPGRAAIDRVIR